MKPSEQSHTHTTVMIRNIPNKYSRKHNDRYTQAQFKAFLDNVIPNLYDFLYLRM
ncbi:hypothetical protein HDV03_002053 [Kappamyces sp. JEL0829]|nr:hypothetical protein HDV03_002053 [Kappamyces sp. JEL0829]